MNNSSTSELAKKNNNSRFKKSTAIYVASSGIGFLTGTSMVLHRNGTINLSTNTLIIGTVLLTVSLFVLTLVWYRSMDEFEQASFNQAGNLAFHTGFLAFPWFILNELGVFPPLDAIVLLFTMTIVFVVYYYGKKFF